MEEIIETAQANCLCVLSVRYEGNDAASHQIDLHQLGQSMQGFARIFASCANLLLTGRLSKHLDVRVVSLPVEEHHCFEVVAMVKSMATSKELWSGAFGAVLAVVVQYVLSRRDQDDMKYLKESMLMAEEVKEGLAVQLALLTQERQHQEEMTQLSIKQLSGTVEKVLGAIDKLAHALRPAARQALTPIDRSCERIDLHANGERFISITTAHKRAFADADAIVSDHLTPYTGVISEFDMTSGTCMVTLEGDALRTPALVLDPIFNRPNNIYVGAMASAFPLRFLAKAELDPDGQPIKLYISDTSEHATEFA
jgi:hypothetical protein